MIKKGIYLHVLVQVLQTVDVEETAPWSYRWRGPQTCVLNWTGTRTDFGHYLCTIGPIIIQDKYEVPIDDGFNLIKDQGH